LPAGPKERERSNEQYQIQIAHSDFINGGTCPCEYYICLFSAIPDFSKSGKSYNRETYIAADNPSTIATSEKYRFDAFIDQ
jgi:hypothetical protein